MVILSSVSAAAAAHAGLINPPDTSSEPTLSISSARNLAPDSQRV